MLKRSGDASRTYDGSEIMMQKPPLGTPLNFEHPMNKDLAMHLAMNEGHGDVVRDLSLYGNHGTLKNMAFPSTPASGWNPGRTGVGLNFDGTDDNIRIPDSESLSPTSAMTAMGWVKGAAQNDKVVVAHYDYTTNQRAFSINSNRVSPYDKLYISISDDGTFGVGHKKRYYSSVHVFDDVWHLICFVFDAGTLKLYIDGVEDTNITKEFDDAITTIHNSTADGTIGCCLSNNNPVVFFNGSIDQVRINNRALTAKEVMDYCINPWQVYEQ